eukprot:scaffold6474_cov189-Amphora_coffeaeformis.AAC.5
MERVENELKASSRDSLSAKAEIQSLKESFDELQYQYHDVVSERDELRATDRTSDIAQLQSEVGRVSQQHQVFLSGCHIPYTILYHTIWYQYGTIPYHTIPYLVENYDKCDQQTS